MKCICVYYFLLFAILGCGNKSQVATSPTLRFEAEWVSIDAPNKSLYIGEKRWCVFEHEPDGILLEGELDVLAPTSMTSVLDITLSSANTRMADRSWSENAEYVGQHVVLIREGIFLRVECLTVDDCKLNGVYKYGSDMSPEKGPDVHEWGRFEQ